MNLLPGAMADPGRPGSPFSRTGLRPRRGVGLIGDARRRYGGGVKAVRRILFGIVVVVFLLLGAWIVFLNTMVEWIPEPANVRMEPSRAILREEDVDPESAFGLLRRACEELDRLKPQDVDRDAESEEWERLAWERWTDDAFPVTRRILDAVGPALELARRAVTVPDAQVPTGTDAEFLLPYLSPTRRLARIFRASALRRMAEGDAAGAVSDALTALRLGNLVSRGGGLINHLVDIACTDIGCQALRVLCLRSGLPQGVAASTIEELWRIESGLEPVAEVLRYEWFACDGSIEAFYAGRSDPDLWRDYLPGWALRPFGRVAILLVGSTPSRSRETVRAVYSNLVGLAEQGASPEKLGGYVSGVLTELRTAEWPLPEDPIGARFSGMLFSLGSRYARKVTGRLALVRATGLVLAIRNHEQATGEPLDSLDALGVPDLAGRYADPFDPERPLRYVVRDDGAWLVYSVGANGLDDRGAYPTGRAFGPATALDDGDIVFPSDEPEERKRLAGQDRG